MRLAPSPGTPTQCRRWRGENAGAVSSRLRREKLSSLGLPRASSAPRDRRVPAWGTHGPGSPRSLREGGKKSPPAATGMDGTAAPGLPPPPPRAMRFFCFSIYFAIRPGPFPAGPKPPAPAAGGRAGRRGRAPRTPGRAGRGGVAEPSKPGPGADKGEIKRVKKKKEKIEFILNLIQRGKKSPFQASLNLHFIGVVPVFLVKHHPVYHQPFYIAALSNGISLSFTGH